MTEGAVYITFNPYKPGMAPALILNHTRAAITICEKDAKDLRLVPVSTGYQSLQVKSGTLLLSCLYLSIHLSYPFPQTFLKLIFIKIGILCHTNLEIETLQQNFQTQFFPNGVEKAEWLKSKMFASNQYGYFKKGQV